MVLRGLGTSLQAGPTGSATCRQRWLSSLLILSGQGSSCPLVQGKHMLPLLSAWAGSAQLRVLVGARRGDSPVRLEASAH